MLVASISEHTDIGLIGSRILYNNILLCGYSRTT
nr:MAG TPA: hypothetical protein [Caudoviricetes sp.]